jgi:Zn-dependent peptidase ImmA (M78 family)
MASKLEKEAVAFIKKKEGTKPSKKKKVSLHNRSLKVGYRDILIQVVTPNIVNDNANEYGQYFPQKHRIEIQTAQKPLDEVNTILHELLHVVITDIGETQKGGLLADEEVEEKFVYNTANYLTQVFRDNKWFLAYLQTQFNE